MPEQEKKRRIAVVLSGGGGKGAYEVGALKALRARGIEPDIYCGTSVGSFNAGMLASGMTLEEVERIWVNLDTSGVFRLRHDPRRLLSLDPRVPFWFAVKSVRLLGSFLGEALRGDGKWWETIDLDAFLIDTSPMEKLVRDSIDYAKLHQSNKEIYIALTRLKPSDGDPLRIVSREHVTHRHILASCSLPFIFPQVTIGSEVFCDGGVVMNSPLQPAISAGADDIYIVDLTPPPRDYRDGTLPLAYQVLSTQFSEALRRDIEFAQELNARHMAAHRAGCLVEGKMEVAHLDTRADTMGQTITRRFRYLNIYIIRPTTDLGGLGGFLKFGQQSAKSLIERGQKEAEAELDSYMHRDISAPDGTTMKVVLRREGS